MGYALVRAQLGDKNPEVTSWKGQGSGVFELVEQHEGDAYRAVYSVRFETTVYVLHVFRKKSPKGIRTDQRDVDLVARRLRLAQEDYRKRSGWVTEGITRGGDNAIADLGFPEIDELQTKVKLAQEINRILEELRLMQADIGALLGINQPKVSALMNFRLDGFSVERLMGVLVALDRDVEIIIRRKPKKRGAPSQSSPVELTPERLEKWTPQPVPSDLN